MDHCAGAWQLKSKLTFLLSESWVSWCRQRLTGSSRFQIPVCATVMQSLQLQSGNFRFSWQEKQKIKTLRVFILAEAGIQPGLVRHQSISGYILVAHTHTGVHVFGLWEESGEHTNSTWPYHMTMRWWWCDLWSMISKMEPVYLWGHVEKETKSIPELLQSQADN